MIGRFSALAVSDIVSIKSYYQGKCYSYLMYKDGETLNIDLLNTIETKYENGVDVQVTVKDALGSYTNIINGLAQLAYFEQIYIDTDFWLLQNFVERFNKRTVHNFNTFKVCSLKEVQGLNLLMGNVLYKCNEAAYKYFGDNPSIAIPFNIGEIDITPNRENLRYSERTKQNVLDKVAKTEREIYEICNDTLSRDFQTVAEWNEIVNKNFFDIKLWEFPENDLYVHISLENLLQNGIKIKSTIKGKDIPEDIAFHYRNIMNMVLPASLFTYRYSCQQFCKPGAITVKSLLRIIEDGDSYYLYEPYKPITKQYFRECVSKDYGMIIRKSQLKAVFHKMLRDYYEYLTSCKGHTFQKDAIRLVLGDILPLFASIKDFNNKDVPKQWIAEYKEKKAATKKRDCVCYELHYKDAFKTYLRNDCTLEHYKKFRGTVVYAERKSKDLRFMFCVSKLGRFSNIVFIEVAKSNLPLLQQQDKRFISIEDFMIQKDKRLVKAFTGYYLKNKYPTLSFERFDTLAEYSRVTAKCLHIKERAERYNQLPDIYKKDFQELYEYYVSRNWIDLQWDAIASNKTLLTISHFIEITKNPYSEVQMAHQIALDFFVLKHNIHYGSEINPISAYKFLKTF